MNAPRLAIFLAMTMFSLAAVPVRTHAYHAAPQLAQQLHGQAGQLSAEIRGNFRQAPNFGRMVANAQQIYALSAQLQALTRANANPAIMSGSVRRLERLIADLENEVLDANAFRGQVAFRRYGPPVTPCDTRLALRMLTDLDRTLVHLDDAIDDLGCAPSRQQQRLYRDFDDDDYGPRGPNYGSPLNYRGRGF